MTMIDNRLRMLLESNEQALSEGKLTTQMLKDVVYESMSFKEPIASDIRMVLVGLSVEKTSSEEIEVRLQQAQRILNLNADYD